VNKVARCRSIQTLRIYQNKRSKFTHHLQLVYFFFWILHFRRRAKNCSKSRRLSTSWVVQVAKVEFHNSVKKILLPSTIALYYKKKLLIIFVYNNPVQRVNRSAEFNFSHDSPSSVTNFTRLQTETRKTYNCDVFFPSLILLGYSVSD